MNICGKVISIEALYFFLRKYPFAFKYIDQYKFLKELTEFIKTTKKGHCEMQYAYCLENLYNYNHIDDCAWIEILNAIIHRHTFVALGFGRFDNLKNLILNNSDCFIVYFTDVLSMIICFAHCASEAQLNKLIALYVENKSMARSGMSEEFPAYNALYNACNEQQKNSLTMLLELQKSG